jgi:DNA-binding PucR family transcriptional regulator
MVAQAGIAAFVRWLKAPDAQLTGAVFGVAPKELARVVSLQQTVELVRITVDTVETYAAELAAPGEEAALRDAVLRFSREVAFAAAHVYATAAEERGAWHARLRALLIDALLRGDPADALRARASALGWTDRTEVAVVVGAAPEGDPEHVLDDAERRARAAGIDALAGLQGDRLVLVLTADALAVRAVEPAFGKGPVVVGPVCSDIGAARDSASAALAGLRVAAAWPEAPRPVDADDLLPERALDGDATACDALADLYKSLDGAVRETVDCYLGQGGSIEATARAMFLHANTVRYRLRKAVETSGVHLTEPRGAFVFGVAAAVGRLRDSP